MKKILFALLAIQLIPNLSSAQDEVRTQSKENFFYVGPADLLFNTLQLGYERKLKKHNTVYLSGGFKLSKKDGIIDRTGGNGEFQYRVNLLYNKEALSTISKKYSTFAYFAPFVQYRYEEVTDANYPAVVGQTNTLTFVNSYFGGVGFGFRLSGLENRFTMNAYAGGGLKYSDVKGDQKYTNFFEVGYTGIAPKVGLQMGIAF